MNNVRPLLPRIVSNKLAEEQSAANIHRVVKFAISGAVAAHRKSKSAANETLKELAQAEMAAYVAVVAEAVGLHEAGPILYDAIAVQNKTFVPELHRMATRIQPADAA